MASVHRRQKRTRRLCVCATLLELADQLALRTDQFYRSGNMPACQVNKVAIGRKKRHGGTMRRTGNANNRMNGRGRTTERRIRQSAASYKSPATLIRRAPAAWARTIVVQCS